MKIKAGVNFHNRFDIVKNGEWVGYAENIVLDQMYSRICNFSTYFVNIHFGTGSGTPTPDRTSLFSHLGTKTAATEEVVRAFPTSKWTRKIVLMPEEYVGQTITEVGVAYGSTASYLVTHAMIKDAEGNPLSISKTALDVVEIYATIFVTLNNTDNIKFTNLPNGNALLNYLTGNTINTSLQLEVGMDGSDNFNYACNLPFFNIASVSGASNLASKKRTYSYRYGINSANQSIREIGIIDVLRARVSNEIGYNGYSFSNKVVGTGDGVETAFSLPHGFIDASSLSLYKDGALVSPSEYAFTNTYADGDHISLRDIYTEVLNNADPNYSKTDANTDIMLDKWNPFGTAIYWKNDNPITVTHTYDRNVKGLAYYAHTAYGTYSDYKQNVTGEFAKEGEDFVTLVPYQLVANGVNAPLYEEYYFEEDVYPRVRVTPRHAGTFRYAGYMTYFRLIAGKPKNIVFNQPPADGSTITASYSVSYIPKGTDFVLDVTFDLQFGEGV